MIIVWIQNDYSSYKSGGPEKDAVIGHVSRDLASLLGGIQLIFFVCICMQSRMFFYAQNREIVLYK